MKKFMLIFHTDGPIDMSGEAGDSMMKWYETNAEVMLDSGNPFDGKSEAQIAGGKVTMDSDTAAGYSLIKADNLEAAVNIAMGNPMSSMAGCSIKVYETMPM